MNIRSALVAVAAVLAAFIAAPNAGAATWQGPVAISDLASNAFLAWRQEGDGGEGLGNFISGRVGSSSTGVWGPIERIFDVAGPHAWSAGFYYRPHPAIADDGTVVVAWDEDGSNGQLVEMARIRAQAGGWGDPVAIGPPHVALAEPSIATDGNGHFATAASPDSGGLKQVLVSFLDLVPPVVSPVALAGTGMAGDPMSLSVTASDTWSAIRAVAWSLGDGATATGLAVSHVYASAGTYVAIAAVTETGGNTTTVQVTITISAKRSALTHARFKSAWKQSRVSGSLVLGGTVPRAGRYVVDVTNGKTRAIRRALRLGAGAFARTITLPPTLLPGRYHVTLVPPFPSTQLQPAARDVTLTAPASGVVDRASLSRTPNGSGSLTAIRASFHFAAVPKGRLTLTWYITSKGRRHLLGTASKAAAERVTSVVRLGKSRGMITVVIARGGVVIAARSIRVL